MLTILNLKKKGPELEHAQMEGFWGESLKEFSS